MKDYIDDKGKAIRVFTGHQEGIITINLKEADPVYREQMRVEFNEPQRTLIGHLRHEYGHYLDRCLEDSWRGEYHRLFGDPQAISYADAKKAYYADGAEPAWQGNCISRYAAMHPWEDFAETTNFYLDVMSILETAEKSRHFQKVAGWIDRSFIDSLNAVLSIAVSVNELNTDLGLPALLPERLTDVVVDKLAFIDGIRIALRESYSSAC